MDSADNQEYASVYKETCPQRKANGSHGTDGLGKDHKHSKKQTSQAGCLLTVDIQTSFHLIFVLLDLEVALMQSPHCADWCSNHLSVRISRCPPPGSAVLQAKN